MKTLQWLWRQPNQKLLLPALLLMLLPAPTKAQTDFSITPVPAPTASTPANPSTSGYLLGSGDQITVTVFGYGEYTGAQTILPDGTITLPLLGSIAAAGQTTDSLTRDLTTRLNTLLVDPVVSVSLNTQRPVVVTVAGEVQRPGPIQLRSTTTAIPISATSSVVNASGAVPTVSSALIEAGGVTRDADIRQVTVRRALPDGSYTTITVNLWEAISADAASQDLVLQGNDTVFVPRLTANATIDRRLIARSSLAPGTVRVRVVGEVTRPGEVQVPPDSSISSAVAIAGGPTTDARLSDVAFVRLNAAGQIERQTVDLRNLTDAYQIQDGDVVIVPKRGSSSFLDFAGRVFPPLNLLINLINGF